MPILEFYCPDNHKIYQFFAKTRAQAEQVPACPDDPAFRLVRVPSTFAIGGGARKSREGEGSSGGAETAAPPPDGAPAEAPGEAGPGEPAEDARMEAAMREMEGTMAAMDDDHPDPRVMGRMMRRMAELSGEKLDDQMEEVVRKLEEGADPDELEEQLGDGPGAGEEGSAGGGGWRGSPSRDPRLYDY